MHSVSAPGRSSGAPATSATSLRGTNLASEERQAPCSKQPSACSGSAANRARGLGVAFSRHLAPQANVSNSLLVARDYHLASLGDGAAVLAASAADAAGADLRVHDLARAAFADGNAEPAEHANHFVVRGIHVLLVRHQHPAQKQENDSAADNAADH